MKKILCLLLCGALILPLAGCERTINGKQIFSTEPQEEHTEEEYVEEETYTIDKIIEMVKAGEYSLLMDGQVVDKFIIQDMMNKLYEEPYWTGSLIDEYNAHITVYNKQVEKTEYVKFNLNLQTGELIVVELLKDGKVLFDDEARTEFADMLVEISDKVEKKAEENETEKKETKKKETDVKLDYVCAQCGKQMYKSMLNSKHENDFCSVKCQDKWYATQKEMNEKKYNCLWCGAAMNEHQYNTWNGCCSEICAVNREGTAYENWERDQNGVAPGKDENMYNGPVPDGGVTICGWCGARVTDGGTFCSKICEKAHHDCYDVD